MILRRNFRIVLLVCSWLMILLPSGGLFQTHAQVAGLSQLWPEEPNAQYILVAGGTVQGGEREYDVPVEAKTFRLQFSARLVGDLVFEILGPGGKQQTLTEPNVGSTVGRDRKVIVVFDPKPGKWRIRLRGTGSFTTAVSTQSELYVCCITVLGSSGPIQANPLPLTVQLKARQAMMQASIAGFEVQSVEFHAIDESNKLIKPIRLRQNDYSNPYLVVMISEPGSQPFRVLARGMDQTGYPFQRMFPTLFHPGPEDLSSTASRDQQLTDMLQNAEPGPYQLVRTKVEDMVDEPLLSESGSPIGVRLKFSLQFPREGLYTPLPQVYPDRIVSGYTGALSLRVHRIEVAPVPEGPQPAVAMRYLARASYKANQLYRFTIDMVPNYAQYNEQKRSFCIMAKAFSYGSRDRFLSEVTSELKVRFRISIMGTNIDGRQPGSSEHTYVPNMWYAGFLKDGSAECQ